jgi:hypothetical protein
VSIISGCGRNVLAGAYGNVSRGLPDARFGMGDKGRKEKAVGLRCAPVFPLSKSCQRLDPVITCQICDKFIFKQSRPKEFQI